MSENARVPRCMIMDKFLDPPTLSISNFRNARRIRLLFTLSDFHLLTYLIQRVQNLTKEIFGQRTEDQ